jgi:hypothetical protein
MSEAPREPAVGSPEATEARALRELADFDAEPRKGALTLPRRVRLAMAGACTERWAEMPGDDRVRRCTRCDREVLDLAGLSPDEVEALATARAMTLPAVVFRRADGSLTTSDCDVDRPRRRAIRVLAVVAIGVAASTAVAYALHRHDMDGVTPASASSRDR